MSSSDGSCRLEDADEADDVEVLCQGKGGMRMMRARIGRLEECDDENGPTALSKRQQQEAARLAEQRKRFDNQRYKRQEDQREGGAGTPYPRGPGKPLLPTSGTSNGPSADKVMGLNHSATTPGTRVQAMACLPGGIEDDEPQVPTMIKSNMQPESFDDDDEKLMKEILDSVDGA